MKHAESARPVAALCREQDCAQYAKFNEEANKRLTDYVANLSYSPTRQMAIGTEYHQGKREVFNGSTTDVLRINFISQYKF